ncbi:tetratricopeptide repeat protein [Floridanema evergladense]|uniref:Tetratricopeptide repeat protein n=1 Tax=Floridaenema evergladense BLCC-F167 TaxID=3153639 RepID=A0ABV4WSE6_9CYAN
MTPSTSSPSEIKTKAATRRIEAFYKRFGQAHLYLAYHAAFPLALTPDLLYRLWANFQRDIQGEVLGIPWIAVADILLSNLCDEVGHELYEMDLAVRNDLLRCLKEDKRFGQQRINELSNFLLEYVQQQLYSDDPDIRDFAQAQKWTALSYTNSIEAARELALAFSKLDHADKPEVLRMASLTDTFSEGLGEEFKPLLVYARAMKNFAHGAVKEAERQFFEVLKEDKVIRVTDVELPVPEQIKAQLEENFPEKVEAPGTLVIPKKRISISLIFLILIATSFFLWSRCSLDEEIKLFDNANDLMDLGKNEQAISIYNQLINRNPKFYQAWTNRGYALAGQKKYKESLDSCIAATKIKPEDFEAFICQGLAYQNLGNNDAALTAFNQALEVIPKVESRDRKRNESIALDNRGVLYLSKMGNFEKAIDDFKRAIDVDDSYYIAQSNLGRALYIKKNYPEAIEAFTKAIDKARETDKKDYEPAWVGRGNAYKELGQKTKALADYDEVTRINPDNYEAWYSRGLLQQEMGDSQGALYSYNQAIRVKPDYQAAIQAKERLLKLTGKQP